MLNRITYSVVFPTNGVSLKGEFKPQPGVTAVVGENGSGKTFGSIELSRYLLFGKAALRGSASDYKKLEVSGEFTIRGIKYTIERNSKKERLLDSTGGVMAVGADAVTKKAEELLGYNLAVFDIANASVQKSADIFGKMKPAERKRMIDEVVGLTSQEAVEKACRTESLTLKREAEALSRTLKVPTEPVKPAGYMSSEKLTTEYENLKTLYDEAQKVANTIRPAYDPEEPILKRPDIGVLQELEHQQGLFQQYQAIASRVRDVEPPKYTVEQLEAAAQRLTIMEMMEGQTQCPACGEKFVPGHGHLDIPEGPNLTQAEIRQAMASLQAYAANEELKASLALLPNPEDPSDKLVEVRSLTAMWETYDRLEAAQKEQLARNTLAMEKLRLLGEIPASHELDYLREVLFDSRGYERDLAAYKKEVATQTTLAADIAELSRRSKAFLEGSTELAEARAMVKAFLAPRLSSVATRLIQDMTNGKLVSIEVDEDMAIKVNGQAIETLSGGGETVANIALRIALGQVLVAQTFPVFFGDEMDADADDRRREAVAAALRVLVDEGHLQQIILVTHRGVDIADHVVDLEDT